ncbi:MAG TPA: hypothetical protein PKE58_10055 [Acidobacteriota bacterium]|nr:hypothetical protein [Acidobacteriota bacterium]
MNCPRCNAGNPDGKKYCGDCGTLLETNLTLVSPEGRAYIKALMKEEFKDRELVEHQVALAVWDIFYKRIQIGTIVIGAFLVILSGLGWSKYKDINVVLQDALAQAEKARAKAQAVNDDVQRILGSAQQALNEANQNVEQVRDNSNGKTKELLNVIKQVSETNPGLAAEVTRGTTDPSIKDALQVITETAQSDPKKVAALPTVFVQFKGDIDRTLVKGFRDELNRKQLPAPGEERIPGTYSNEVRYFDPGDAATAQTVTSLASDYFKRKNCSPSDFQVKLIPSPSGQKNLKGQIEVWISGNCKGT